MVIKWLTRLLAVFGLMFFIIVGYGTYAVFTLRSQKPSLPAKTALVIDLDREIKGAPGGGLDSLFSDNNLYLTRVITAIDQAAKDDHITALSLEFGATSLPLAEAQELRDAVKRFQLSKKPVMAFGDSLGEMAPANGNILLAVAADDVWLQPVGLIGLTGVAAEVPFARGLLDKLAIAPQAFKRYEGKTFANTFTENDLTPAHAEELGELVADLNDALVQSIAKDRGLTVDQVKSLMAEAPIDADMALKSKLITHVGYRDEYNDALEDRAGTSSRTTINTYVTAAPDTPENATKLAVVTVSGMIERGKSDPTGTFGGAGGDTIARALRDAAADGAITAIILRIDSGGGSPTASETIRRAVVQARKSKPVIVSMASAAASGGYWIATDATKIVTMPTTLTGSLGVFGGKLSLEGFWQSIGMHWALVSASPNGGLSSFNHPFNDNETRRLNVLFDSMHAEFRDRVGKGRNLPEATVKALTSGRAYSGQRALGLKLVDALGGMHEAIAIALTEAGKPADSAVALVDFPKSPSVFEKLFKGLYQVQSTAGSIGAITSRLSAEARPLTAISPMLDITP